MRHIDRVRVDGTLVRRNAYERLREKLILEDWRKEDSCLLFTGAQDNHGHGNIRYKKNGHWTTRKAHQVAFEHYHGWLPSWPFVIRHTCDSKTCCLEQHLIPGHYRENMQDMFDRHLRYRKTKKEGVE